MLLPRLLLYFWVAERAAAAVLATRDYHCARQASIGASCDSATASLDALVMAEESTAMAAHDLSRGMQRARRAAAARARAAEEARLAAAAKQREAAAAEREAAAAARAAAEEPHGARFAGGVYEGPAGRSAQLVVAAEPSEVRVWGPALRTAAPHRAPSVTA